MIIPQDKCNCAIDVVVLYSAIICDDHTLSGAATIQNIKHVGIRGRIENIEYSRTSTSMKMHRQQCRVHGIDYSSINSTFFSPLGQPDTETTVHTPAASRPGWTQTVEVTEETVRSPGVL